ncbi:MAG: hypothetical protein EPN47_05175 [Acidobacteria bacterium]|nr:MAG: hypothetical protein EPN47_05175 [Acidobacteriota bacterium]
MPVNATAIDEPKGIQALTKPARPTKQEGASQAAAPAARFFLAKPGANSGAPTLDRECATEAEAMAEAFKAGTTYYAVTEYRAVVDCTGKQPQFKKEVVRK